MESDSDVNRRARLFAHRSPLGTWDLLLLNVHEILRGIVTHIWYGEGKVAYTRDRILPRASSLLLINLGPPQFMVLRGPPEQRVAFNDMWYSGISDTPIDTEAPFGSRIIGVTFTAVGAAIVLHLPARLTANQTGSFEELVGVEARRLRQRLLNTAGALECLSCVEEFLIRRCMSGTGIHPLIGWASQSIADSRGRIGTGHLVQTSGYSRKHLARIFKEQVGLPPKSLARIHRFQAALQQITRCGRRDWCNLALETGYYDQAHLINEFQVLTGLTPREIAAKEQPDRNSVVLW